MIPGHRIRDIRETLGWSTLDLARACSMRELYLINIEQGVTLKVHTRTYQKIADALGVTLGVLMGDEEIPSNISLEDELPEQYRWLIKNTLKLVLLLGALTLILSVFAAVLYLSIFFGGL